VKRSPKDATEGRPQQAHPKSDSLLGAPAVEPVFAARIGDSEVRFTRRLPLLTWRVARGLLFAGLGIGAFAQSVDAQVAHHCSERLVVKLTPDVPDPRAPSFLDSLSADPLFHLSWVRSRQGSVVLDLIGPGPEYRCRSEVRRIRRDGRVVWLRVLRGH
jgi:hypothetical protein